MQRLAAILCGSSLWMSLAASAAAQLPTQPPDEGRPPAPMAKAAEADPLGRFLQFFGAGDLAKAAADLRAAGEAFAQFGGSLEHAAEAISAALIETSANHAAISREFDPFGFKAGHHTIQAQQEIILEQQRFIQQLQQAEIDRLRKELAALRRQTKAAEKKMSQQ